MADLLIVYGGAALLLALHAGASVRWRVRCWWYCPPGEEVSDAL